MVNMHQNGCSSLALRQMQMKATVRYPCTPIGMTQLKVNGNTNVDQDEEKQNHSYIAGGNVKYSTATLRKGLADFYKSRLAVNM